MGAERHRLPAVVPHRRHPGGGISGDGHDLPARPAAHSQYHNGHLTDCLNHWVQARRHAASALSSPTPALPVASRVSRELSAHGLIFPPAPGEACPGGAPAGPTGPKLRRSNPVRPPHRPREILTRNRISHKCKTMEAKERKSFLSGIPSWALSIMTAAFSLIFLFAIGYPLQTHYGENIGGWITYISTGIVITVACFFICRKYPNSVWYTPIICNAVGIIAAIIEPNFWGTSMWIPYLIGWVFSLLGAFSGAWIGRQAATKANL